MAPLIRRLAALVVGMALGLSTAWLAAGGPPPFGSVRSGPWTAWPQAGGPDADPYARAILSRDGGLPLSPTVGLRFLAMADSDGRALDGGCDYRVMGPTPAAADWTLAALDRAGFAPPTDAGRAVLTSTEIVRSADGTWVVTVASGVRPGNWLPARPGHLTLMLSLYDTPLGRALRMGGSVPELPAIARGGCPKDPPRDPL